MCFYVKGEAAYEVWLGLEVGRVRFRSHWVAVKVQRPNLTFILRRDLVLIRALGVITAPLLPLNLGFGLGGITDAFGRTLDRKRALHAKRVHPGARPSTHTIPPPPPPPPLLLAPSPLSPVPPPPFCLFPPPPMVYPLL